MRHDQLTPVHLSQLAMGAFVNYFFSGFIMGRVPFPLSPSFRIMLQVRCTVPTGMFCQQAMHLHGAMVWTPAQRQHASAAPTAADKLCALLHYN